MKLKRIFYIISNIFYNNVSMSENKRLKQLQNVLNFSSQEKFAAVLGIKQGSLSDIYREKEGIKVSSSIKRILEKEYSINIDWLENGNGSMFVTPPLPGKHYGGEGQDNNLIPFYDDVITVGGNKDSANVEGISAPADYIDTGDWFRDATAAIRHYGESMDEYPTGCILAIKEVQDRELVIPGRDYCIETSEYRVTKRLQHGKDKKYITAYSTNPETYADGRLIHEPFDIPWRAITRISLVLGYVVKKNGGTVVFSNNKK